MPTSPFKKLGGDQGGAEDLDLDGGKGLGMGRKGALRKGGSEEGAATTAKHARVNSRSPRLVGGAVAEEGPGVSKSQGGGVSSSGLSGVIPPLPGLPPGFGGEVPGGLGAGGQETKEEPSLTT